MPRTVAGTTLRTLRVGFYPYTGYMATAADGSRSGYAYELLQDIAQHENAASAYSCLDGNTQQAMQQLAAGQIDLIPGACQGPRSATTSLPFPPSPSAQWRRC